MPTHAILSLPLLALLALGAAGQSSGGSEPVAEVSVDERLAQARVRHQTGVADAVVALWEKWQKDRDAAQEKGDREKMKKLEAPRREFDATGIVPDGQGLPASAYYSAMSRHDGKLIEELEAVGKELTRAGRGSEADAVLREISQLRDWLACDKAKRRQLGEQLLSNPGAEDKPTNKDPLPGWDAVRGPWLRIDAKGGRNPGPYKGDWYFSPGATQTAVLQQDVDVRCFARATDAGKLRLEVSGHLSSYRGQDDQSQMIVECLDAKKEVLAKAYDSKPRHHAEWKEYRGEAALPSGTRYLRFTLRSSLGKKTHGEKNNNGYYDALSLCVVAAEAR